MKIEKNTMKQKSYQEHKNHVIFLIHKTISSNNII